VSICQRRSGGCSALIRRRSALRRCFFGRTRSSPWSRRTRCAAPLPTGSAKYSTRRLAPKQGARLRAATTASAAASEHFLGWRWGRRGSVHEPLVARGQEAPQPQAHRVARAAKTAPRTTDALRLSVDHQLPAQAKVLIDGRFHGQIESEPRVRKIGVHNQAFIMEAPDPHLFSREALPLGGGLPASASTPAFPSLAEQSTVLPSSPGQDLYRSD
jgi:hypothetical protein